MDAFAIAVIVLVATAVTGCCLAARAGRGRRVGEFGGRRAIRSRVAATEAARREAEDLDQMLEATNARRRARGLPERTAADAMREFGQE